MADRVGFIGLGIMGRPMAKNLMTAGYPLVVHNRTGAKAAELVKAGATAVGSPRDVRRAKRHRVHDAAGVRGRRAHRLGTGRRAGRIRPGGLVIDMSTICPSSHAGWPPD